MYTVNTLSRIIEKVSTSYGADFFDRMTKALALAVNADCCLIAKIDETLTNSHTVSVYSEYQHVDNFQYALQGTPCQEVTCGRLGVYPADVVKLFPDDLLLAEMGIEAYVGASLKNGEGKVLGLVVALYQYKIDDPQPIQMLYQLFSARIALELDRMEKTQALQEANENLEMLVERRTKDLAARRDELAATLEDLTATQTQLVESEKMAALGQLVAGVAHEINTPIGTSLTAVSQFSRDAVEMSQHFETGRIKRSQLGSFIQDCVTVADILAENLNSTLALVRAFKQVSADHVSQERRTFALAPYLQQVRLTLAPPLKEAGHTLLISCPKELEIDGYPGVLSGILTNLVMNAIRHAYPQGQHGEIHFDAQCRADRLVLTVADQGVGILAGHLGKIFDPFFTTGHEQGGTGLGLHIVYNQVTQVLHGTIRCDSTQGQGTRFILTMPMQQAADGVVGAALGYTVANGR